MMTKTITTEETKKIKSLFKGSVSAWAPPENLTVDEWADKYRRLDSSASAEPGPWRTDRTPYMREPMRAFTQPEVEEITLVSPSQVGKSELELNIIAYIIDQDPGTILYIQPRKEDAQEFSRIRVAPMIDNCSKIKNKIKDLKTKGRSTSSTILHKTFPGGTLKLVGTHSASDLSSTPVRYVIGDELDRFVFSAGRDGDPWELAKRRQNTFFNRKRVAVSTPTIAGESQIEFLFLRGTQERWKTQCPHCTEYHEILFDNIRFTPSKKRIGKKEIWTAEVHGWRCPNCLEVIPEETVKQSPSKWIADNPDAIHTNKARSFWLNGFSSPWRPWSDIIQAFLEAQHSPEKLKVWKNTDCGQLWEERTLNIEEQTLLDRCEDYPEGADLPEGVLCLTMGVDCQKRYLQWEVVGWSRYWESWGISTGMIPGSPDDLKTWRQLDAVISRKFKFPNGKALYISLTFIDSGDGKFTNEIAAYCHARESRNVFAIKGSSSFDKPFINAPSHIPVAADSNQKYWLYNIGVSSGKSIIYSALTIKDKGPNYMHFPRDESRGYNLNYFTQLISETLTREGKMLKWTLRPGHERNEALDIRNYARAAIQVLNPNFDAIERALKREPSEKKAKKSPNPKPKRSSRADEFFD